MTPAELLAAAAGDCAGGGSYEFNGSDSNTYQAYVVTEHSEYLGM